MLCSICGIVFKSGWALKEHMNSHSNQETIYCQQCDYKGTRKCVRTLIANVHSSQSFTCNHCESKFTKHSNLNRDVETVHNFPQFDCNL